MIQQGHLCVMVVNKQAPPMPMVKRVVVLDSEGKRICAKYYNEDLTLSQQQAFEKSLFLKTYRVNTRQSSEIMLFENQIVVYRFSKDVHFYVSGDQGENEIILGDVLEGLFDTLSMLLRSDVQRRTVMDNLDMLLLLIDEMLDNGAILEIESDELAKRVAQRSDGDVPLSEQTLTQALANAKEQIARSLLK